MILLMKTDFSNYITITAGVHIFNLPFKEETKDNILEAVTAYEEAVESSDIKLVRSIIKEVVIYCESLLTTSELVPVGKYMVQDTTKNVFYFTFEGATLNYPLPRKFVDIFLKDVESGNSSDGLSFYIGRFINNPFFCPSRLDQLAQEISSQFVVKAKIKELREAGYSEEESIVRSTVPDKQITNNGILVTYKAVKEVVTAYALDKDEKIVTVPRYTKTVDPDTGDVTTDVSYPEFVEDRLFEPAIYTSGDKFLCGDKLMYNYKVGVNHSLPSWNMVSVTDGRSHERGLHSGGINYVENYLGKGRQLLCAFVDPSMIGKFTGVGGELTSKDLFIYGHANPELITGSLYHHSKLFPVTDDLKATIVENIEKINSELEANK